MPGSHVIIYKIIIAVILSVSIYYAITLLLSNKYQDDYFLGRHNEEENLEKYFSYVTDVTQLITGTKIWKHNIKVKFKMFVTKIA